MDPIATVASSGLSEALADNLYLGLLLIGGVFVAKWFMDAFKQCHESTKEVVKNNTAAFHQINVTLEGIKSRIEK